MQACVEMRESTSAHSVQGEDGYRVKVTGIGAHVGQLLFMEEIMDVLGDPVNTASKLGEDLAHEEYLRNGGWVDGWMDGWMDGRIDGWMDGWMHGRKDGWLWTHIPNSSPRPTSIEKLPRSSSWGGAWLHTWGHQMFARLKIPLPGQGGVHQGIQRLILI